MRWTWELILVIIVGLAIFIAVLFMLYGIHVYETALVCAMVALWVHGAYRHGYWRCGYDAKLRERETRMKGSGNG